MTAEAIAAGIRAGDIAPDVLVCSVGSTVWKAIGDVGELALAALDLEPDTEQVPMDRLTAPLGQLQESEQASGEADDLPTLRPSAPDEGV
jgi:hypothetical protein